MKEWNFFSPKKWKVGWKPQVWNEMDVCVDLYYLCKGSADKNREKKGSLVLILKLFSTIKITSSVNKSTVKSIKLKSLGSNLYLTGNLL